MSIIIPVVVLCGLGAFIGILLAIADKKLAVETNPMIEDALELLPMGNCAGCGYAGCSQYAEAVVSDPDVGPDLCPPGGNETAQKLAALTGKAAAEIKAVTAVPQCAGCEESGCPTMFEYKGLKDCRAAATLFEGEKYCEFGCIGFGNCERVCPSDALHMNPSGLPVIDPAKCTGCAICAKECPRGVISMVPENAVCVICCNSNAKGAQTRKECTTGCIACRMCVKACPHDAMSIVDNLCVVDYDSCQFCEEPECLKVECKPGVIKPGVNTNPGDKKPEKTGETDAA